MDSSGEGRLALSREHFVGVISRRSQVDIIQAIIKVATRGAKKTEIVYKSNLTFTRTTRYLQYLEEQGLLRRDGDRWFTTEKGYQFLEDLERLNKYLT
ncbi:MAG: winged helix-turn-helix domain-containing protein [Candidatus Bathyarchaeia archaeon]